MEKWLFGFGRVCLLFILRVLLWLFLVFLWWFGGVFRVFVLGCVRRDVEGVEGVRVFEE